MRDLSYTFALGRLPLLAKKEDREKHHDAHQAAWLVTEGRATPTTEAALGREPDNGAFALLSASWSKWLSNEEMNRLQVALVAVGKPAKPMLEATFDTLQTQLQTLQGDFNKYARDSIAKAGRLGLIADDNPEAKKKLDTLLQETKDRGKQHQMEVKQYDRMLAWTKETYQQIKD